MSAALLQLGEIAYHVVVPILLMAGVGWLLQRLLGMDMPTLTRLNFYLVIPAIVYFSVVSSARSAADVGVMVGFSLLVLPVFAAATLGLALLLGVPRDRWRALLLTNLSYNSGNYGLPLQELAWRKLGMSGEAMALQVFVMLTQNILNFTLGVTIAAGQLRDGQWRKNMLHVLRFPPVYALAAALLTVWVRGRMSPQTQEQLASALRPFWDTVSIVSRAFVPVALATLGAQLAALRGDGVRYPLRLSVLGRLLMGPAIAFVLLWTLGIHGLVGQVLLISTSTPTAVNCMLICMEFDNHPDFVAKSVFYSTLLSPITVSLTILLAQSGALGAVG